ncbi:hypothetical protein OG792_32860 [Micromonospora sp. NBC_01699]|uniref:hypothetical protein n=1 Tax=Micromonospora sp. NBC_01699 TaxID=2975984 RepID=UPI002E29654C|nr:hypothetical protein [Micromonospora sp. NBC_01699]
MTVWRYIAQRALTGEFVHWEVPLARDELTWALSGAGALRGTIAPDVGALRAPDGRLVLDEWGTLLYAEADGQIRWGGIVVRSGFNGPAWEVEAAGFTTYPHGLPYLGDWASPSVDPAEAFRHIWSHVQGSPDGNLGVVVDGTATPARLGTTDEPYALNWWEAPDCGGELDTLAQEGRFDYAEEHAWSGPSTIAHRIRIGYPRIGRRREDLAFVQGDNVTSVVAVDRDGGEYANGIHGLGAGEGRAAVATDVVERDGRLRRISVYADKSVTSKDRLTTLARGELAIRRNVLEVASVDLINHPNAPIGSWQVGDDVLIQAELPWLGEVALWERITGWSLIGEDRARLLLRRSDAFTYGGI